MFKTKFAKLAIALTLAQAGTASLWATGPKIASVNGEGTLFVTDNSPGNSTRRKFSVTARERADGTVTGHAVLRNPQYVGSDEKRFYADIEISCMHVVGNIAIMGGFARRTNDPNLMDAVFFTVQDNGEPGKNRDKISDAYFWDDDPNTTGDPAACMNTGPNHFPLHTIDSGNIQVKP
jgi:hypothetical protein